MGSKYRGYGSDRPNISKELRRIHPIWRGVGFAFMVLIPIMSFAAMEVTLQQNDRFGWFLLPLDLMAKPDEFLFKLIPDPLLYIKIALFVMFLFLFYVIFLLISSIISGIAGPSPKDDPFYVPPVRRTKVTRVINRPRR